MTSNSMDVRNTIYEPKFRVFWDLMRNRVQDILLVSSFYDAFTLEEDGQLTERILSQYLDMQLRYAPRVHHVTTGERALEEIQKNNYDLILPMTRLADMDVVSFGKKVKEIDPSLPVILLAYDEAELRRLPKRSDPNGIDKIFLWNNDSKILLAIIKYVEDLLNVDHDTEVGQVRVVILVEDSVRHYSALLPLMYTETMKLTRNLIEAGLNDLHRLARMRARPKILHADTYEDAWALYKKYKHNVLGVISDVRYWRNGVKDPDSGVDLIASIKEENPYLPLALNSTESRNRDKAEELGVAFFDKNSPQLLNQLREFMLQNMGFGDFVFRLPNGAAIDRARTIQELADRIQTVNEQSILFHANLNHFSTWLVARGEIKLAERLRPYRIEDFNDSKDIRHLIWECIQQTLDQDQGDVITDFNRRMYSGSQGFVRLGNGSLGGKGRGIAFIRALLHRYPLRERYPDIHIRIPRTGVITTEEFEHFLDRNHLHDFAIHCNDDEKLRKRFLKAELSPKLLQDLYGILEKVTRPLAVRSSSLLEDSHYQPFAGLYQTFMLSNNHESRRQRLSQLSDAIKLIYASVFSQSAKAYFNSTSYSVGEERMAVIIQELVGTDHDGFFYPTISGVAQSHNFYPVGRMKSEEGIVQLALGLGKIVVEGGGALRVCPSHPTFLPQFSSPQSWLKGSQSKFYALDLKTGESLLQHEDDTLVEKDLAQAEKDGVLPLIGSVFDAQDGVIRDTLSLGGPRIVTFNSILRWNEIPLAKMLTDLLKVGHDAMGCPVEIEFAVRWNTMGEKPSVYVLQIRPLILGAEAQEVSLGDFDEDDVVLKTNKALGNGIYSNLFDLVFVRDDVFNLAKTPEIALEIGAINDKLMDEERPYALIGPGRWGSVDRWLGVPVNWGQIAGARMIVEVGTKKLNVEPSQGTHFFQNITSLGIGYMTLELGHTDCRVDWDWLMSQPVVEETDFVRHIRLSEPLCTRIEGRTGKGVMLKPGRQFRAAHTPEDDESEG